MADMTRIKGRIAETIYPNGTGAITAESHQALLLEMVDDINAKKADKEEVTAVAESVSTLSQEVESNYNNFTESLDALEQKVDNLPQGDVFDKEGNYPSLRVGTADTAIDLAGRGESVPAEFGFRASGGKSIKDGRAYIKRIKGNSVVWNQLVKDNLTERTINGVTFTPQGDGGILVNGTASANAYYAITDNDIYVANHKVFLIGSKNNVGIMFGGHIVETNINKDYIFSKAESFSYQCFLFVKSGSVIENVTIYPIVCDLTKAYPNNEPTTIEDFNARVATLGVDMNAYNEGQVIHCNTESIKSVGDNAWDEEWELGYIQESGLFESDSRIRSKNFTKVIPNETYYFYGHYGYGIYFYDADKNYVTTLYVNNNKLQIPSNAAYLKFNFPTNYGTTYKGDYMISLVHSGWKQDIDAGYQPYWQDTLPLPIIRKYFPQGMKSAGSAHDEIRYNKATQKWEVVQRIGSVDMGTLNWAYANNAGLGTGFYVNLIAQNNNSAPIVLSNCYLGVSSDSLYRANRSADKVIAIEDGRGIRVHDSSYTDAASFKAAMQGVILYYESNDWEWVELDAEDQNFRDYYNVADFGTEQSQSSVPSAAFSADIIYQFNAVDMIREHELEITELQKVIATMQAQLASLINKE